MNEDPEKDNDLWERVSQRTMKIAKAIGFVLAVILMIAWLGYSVWREWNIYVWLLGN